MSRGEPTIRAELLGRAARLVPVLKERAYAFGSYPEIDDLAVQQARETDRKRRETLLHQIQKIAYERAMFAPIWEFAQLQGVGPRVEEAGLGLIEYMPFSAPYEDMKLKAK